MTRVLPLLILILLLVAPAAAQITAEVGETWIRWDWSEEYGPGTMIYVDGENESTAAGRHYIYLSDLNPAEEHQLALVNASTGATLSAARVQTLSPISTVLFFTAIELILAILCIAMQDPVRVVLVGALGGTLGFYLFGLCLGHGALWLVVLGIVGFQALFVILAMYSLLADALDWW